MPFHNNYEFIMEEPHGEVLKREERARRLRGGDYNPMNPSMIKNPEIDPIRDQLIENTIFLKVRDNCKKLIKNNGSAKLYEIIKFGDVGKTSLKIKCVDRLVELGEIYEITRNVSNVSNLDRVFSNLTKRVGFENV